jgi:hypothetical protein
MFGAAILAGRRAGDRRPASIIRLGFALSTAGMALLGPIVPKASSGWYLVIPLALAGTGLGLLVSQLNNYTLAPIDEERISEAAGVNSAAGSFGLSFGLAVAGGVLLAVLSLSFTNMTEASNVIPANQQQQIAEKLDEDAEVTSNAKLEQLLAEEPKAVRDEVLSINTDATNRSLQVALFVPIIASLIGLFNSFRMMRLPEIEPRASVEGATLG